MSVSLCLECDAESFQCDDGLCLRASVRCNGEDNCLDASDEAGCGKSAVNAVTIFVHI